MKKMKRGDMMKKSYVGLDIHGMKPKRWSYSCCLEHVKRTTEQIRFPNFVSGGDVVLEPEDFCTQYIMHTTYHRGQLLSMLKMLGKEGETTDYLFYLFHLEEQ
ncbi:MAG: hypothetical protein AYK18_17555 [Theionarchaea archaeon DG-70]|nr:MAG: hypothetical protein AYK18_17555 [Theionarchaea archaeon DG-70]